MHHVLEQMDATPSYAVKALIWTILAIVVVTLAFKLLANILRARRVKKELIGIRARHLTEAWRPQVEGKHSPIERIGRAD